MSERTADTPRVAVVGAVNVDLTVWADRLPGPGETVVGARVVRNGGGKGANAAVAAAAAGASTLLVGAVGDDDAGVFALDDLSASKVDTAGVLRLVREATGTALIVVDRSGENQIAVGLGANAAVRPEHVSAAIESAAAGLDCVLVSTEISGAAVIAAVHAAGRAGVPCVLNPAPVIPEVAELLEHGVILTPNQGEARDLARLLGLASQDVGEIAGQLAERTCRPVVVTLGADGVLIADPAHGLERLPAVSVPRVVDTTGAGDCFNGSFVAALAAGHSLGDAAGSAVRAAGESVRWPGARAP